MDGTQARESSLLFGDFDHVRAGLDSNLLLTGPTVVLVFSADTVVLEPSNMDEDESFLDYIMGDRTRDPARS